MSVSLRLIGIAICTGLLMPAAACRRGASKPNIIFILVDTLRADYTGPYGFEGNITPGLDRLAEASIVFRNCFTQSPWTKPAVASLFSSLYPQVHGLTNHEGKYWGAETTELRTGILSDSAVTLAERLREAGYRTAGFVSNPWLVDTYGFAQGFDTYHDEDVTLLTTVTDLVDDARAWLEADDSGRPYFMYLHFMDVHAPYAAPKTDFEVVRRSPTIGEPLRLAQSERPDVRWNNIEVKTVWADEDMRLDRSYWRARYASGVRVFDRRLSKFLRYLSDTGELDRSLLVLTADHGEELFEHGDWSHGQNLYDHQLHIPLIVRNPGAGQGGSVVDDIVELVDLMPTLLAVAGAEPVAAAQGRDVSRLLHGGRVDGARVTFATATQRTPGLYSARTAEYKLVYDVNTDRGSLFDLRDDPGEQRDVASERADVAERLKHELLTHISESLAGGTLEAETTGISDDLRKKLKALGYVD